MVLDRCRNTALEPASSREATPYLRHNISSKFQGSQECHPAPKSPRGVLQEEEQPLSNTKGSADTGIRLA